jgi:enoyl-CoA hydratase/carnithine racemase
MTETASDTAGASGGPNAVTAATGVASAPAALAAANRTQLADYHARHFGWSVSAGIATLTLNRPERKNPLTFESYAELRDLFRLLAYATDVKAIVIHGAGDNFCSGGDVHEIIGPLVGLPLPELLAFTRMTGDVVKAMRHCPQPIVAAVDGICAGAGAIVAMAADLRLGTARSKLAFLFTRVGLAACDMGACAILPRLIGQGRAADLLFTGRSASGDEGYAWGFYNRLCEPAALLADAQRLAADLAAGPTFAHGMTKNMLHQEWSMSIDQAIEAEAQAQAICMATQDFGRAYRAFAAKSRPVFEGD